MSRCHLWAQNRVLARKDASGAVWSELGCDLTGAHLFLGKAEVREQLTEHLRSVGGQRTSAYRHSQLLYFAVVRLLLQALSRMHTIWSTRTPLAPAQTAEHQRAVDQFRHAWLGLGWKPTVWVHWACAHSGFFVTKYRTVFGFSSIPTEHRHQKFKQDLRNTCAAWKFRDPLRCKGYLKRCVKLDALDQGLRLRKMRKVDPQAGIFPATHSGVSRVKG